MEPQPRNQGHKAQGRPHLNSCEHNNDARSLFRVVRITTSPRCCRRSPGWADRRPAVVSATVRILVLGGTSFVGRAIVDDALNAGADVTLFSRGKTGAGLFPELTRLAPPNRSRSAASSRRAPG